MPSLLKRWRRDAVDTPASGRAEELLDELVVPEDYIDRFDATYLDDLPTVLREAEGLTDDNVRDSARWPALRELWELGGRDPESLSLAELSAVIASLDVRTDRYAAPRVPEKVQKRFHYDRVKSWGRAAGVRLSGDQESRDVINELQKEYSLQSGGDQAYTFADLGRPETGDPWTPLMRQWAADGVVSADEPVLTIGPRWTSEITYFRETVGLGGTIGLDLMTTDEELVKVGDMHDMPFDDNTFGLVYQRNTFNKSYDIRAALRECVRVLRDGGVLVTDDCYGYTDGVSELARTSIKHNIQVLRVVAPNDGEVLLDKETESEEDWIERLGQLAVKVRK